jgi:hypothetical protein
MYFRDRIRIFCLKQVYLRAELGCKAICPVASFVLGIHFKNKSSYDSRCPFGKIYNRKQMLGKEKWPFGAGQGCLGRNTLGFHQA